MNFCNFTVGADCQHFGLNSTFLDPTLIFTYPIQGFQGNQF